MMNIVQMQEKLKDFSMDQLVREMQAPSGNAPPYLILSEITRRKQMESSAAGQQAPQTSVAEDAVAAAGVPQGGIADMARALAPQTDVAQNTGVQAMARGGPVKKMAEGDIVIRDGLQYVEQADGSLRLKESERGARDTQPLTADEQAMFTYGVPASELGSLGRRLMDPMARVPADFRQSSPDNRPLTADEQAMFTYGVPASGLGSLGRSPTDPMAGVPADFRQSSPDNRPLTADEQAMFTYGVPASELGSLGREPRREPPGMNTREEALAIALARPRGTGGAQDALLADGLVTSNRVNVGALLPRPEDLIAPPRPADPIADFRENFGMAEDAGEAGQNAEGGDSFMEMLRRALPARTSPSPSAEDPGFVDPYADMINQAREQNATAPRIPRGESAFVDPYADMINQAREQNATAAVSASSDPIADFREDFGMEYSDPNTISPADVQKAEDTNKLDALRTIREIDEKTGVPTEPTTPAGGGAGETGETGGAGGGGGGGAGGVSSYEQQLMDALASREKAATQDKWLALAQVGLNMMSSTNPTLLGAVGEAGLKGVEAARSARDQYDKDKLELQGAIEQSRMARAAAAARSAGGARGAGGGIGGLKLKDYLGQIKNVADVARNSLTLLTGGLAPQLAMDTAEAEGDLETQLKIKSAYDRALQADQDYMSAVQSLGVAPTTTFEEDDDTNFSVTE